MCNWIKRCVTIMMVFFVAIGVFSELSEAPIFASEEMETGNFKSTQVSEEVISQEHTAMSSSRSVEETQEIIVTKDAGAGDLVVTKAENAKVDEVKTDEAKAEAEKAKAEAEKAKAEAEKAKAEAEKAKRIKEEIAKNAQYAAELSELQASATKSVKESDWSAISFVEELDNGTRIYSFEGDTYTVPANLLKREPMVSSDGYVEKITEVPHYVQQSYPYTDYGGYGTVSSHGCGITSCAMVYSYLLDYEIRPDELAEEYGRYNTYNGSLYSLFIDSAADFNLEVKMTYSWNEVVEGLKQGCVVIANVDDSTIFTTGGHYIVYYGISNEGKILINDSNLYNYGDWRSDALAVGFKNGFDPRYCNYSFPCFIYSPKDIEAVARENNTQK